MSDHVPNLGWLKLLIDARGGRYCLYVPVGAALWGLACLVSFLLTKCN